MRDFRIAPAAMGVLLSAFFWTYGVFQMPAGAIVDRFGIRRTYAAGFLVWSLASAAIALSRAPADITGLRLLLGLAEAVAPLASISFIRNNFAAQDQGLPTSIYTPLAAFAPIKSMPRWLRGLLLWGSGPSARIPTQAQRASAGVAAPVLRARLAALLTVDASAAAARVRVPMLVISARRDRLLGSRAAREILHYAPHAELVALAGPHLLLQTRPRECAGLVARFIRSLRIEVQGA